LQLYLGTTEICQPFTLQQKMLQANVFNPILSDDSKIGSAIFVPFESSKILRKIRKNATLVRFSDYYLNNTL
jgi:hypothetical protein